MMTARINNTNKQERAKINDDIIATMGERFRRMHHVYAVVCTYGNTLPEFITFQSSTEKMKIPREKYRPVNDIFKMFRSAKH
jgi:hypothetical protein